MAALQDQVQTLLRRVEDLERTLVTTDADPVDHRPPPDLSLVAPSPDPDAVADPTPEHPAGSSRRDMLRAVGAAAATAVGGTVALTVATAGPAAAADGATMKVGDSQSGSGANSVTRLNNSSFVVEGGPTSPIYGIQDKVGVAAIAAFAQGVDAAGVRAYASETGPGLSAESMRGNGVEAVTTAAGKASLRAETTALGAVGVLARSTRGPGIQLLAGPSMPPFTGTWVAGSLVVNNGQLWYCYLGGIGEASKWVRLSSTFTALAGSVRVYDSRPGTQPAVGTKTRFDSGTVRVIDAKTNGAILPGASAVLLNVVATETNPAGYFSFWRNGTPWPGTSSINWNRADTTIANSVVTSLDPNGRFQARMEGVGGAHLVVDVVGFYL